MSDSHAPAAQAPDHSGGNFQAYLTVFIALGILTLASFGAFLIFGQGQGSMWIILAISVAKATLVAMIFMHLKFDWGRVYCIVIPVCVMAVMMTIVLCIDQALSWKVYE